MRPSREGLRSCYVIKVSDVTSIRRSCNCAYATNGGSARTRGQLKDQANKLGIGIVVGIGEVFEEGFASAGRGHLSKPDGGFDSLDLTEKRTVVVELMIPPMLKQTGGFR